MGFLVALGCSPGANVAEKCASDLQFFLEMPSDLILLYYGSFFENEISAVKRKRFIFKVLW